VVTDPPMTEVSKIVTDRLRAAELARAASDPSHPNADLLTAFAEQTLSAPEREGLLQHLAACGDCRELIALALPPEAVASTPVAAEAEAVRTRQPGVKSSRNWLSAFAWPSLRWTALAAGVVVAASVLLFHHGDLPVLTPSNLQVAINAPSETAPQPAAPSTVQAPARDKSLAEPVQSENDKMGGTRAKQPSNTDSGILMAEAKVAEAKKDMDSFRADKRSPQAPAIDSPGRGKAAESVEVRDAAAESAPSAAGNLLARNEAPAIVKTKPAPQEVEAQPTEAKEQRKGEFATAYRSELAKTVSGASALPLGAAGKQSMPPNSPAARASQPAEPLRPEWCQQLPRPEYAQLERVLSDEPWFEIYRIRPGVFAIYEPKQFEEVISYLIVGEKRALLFDTGLGIGKIGEVASRLTSLPVTVLNSHTHFDHVGGNAEFQEIWNRDLAYTRQNMRGEGNGYSRDALAAERLCGPLPAGTRADSYATRPWKRSHTLQDAEQINLGGRELQVIFTPGHTPDSLMLLDRKNGLLFTGDTFYPGPIYLFVPETDFAAYAQSVVRLAGLEPQLQLLLPAHNVPVASPAYLHRLAEAVQQVQNGKAKGKLAGGHQEYVFDGFSLLLPAPAPEHAK
jgi:glyoxylase-like metal-dependent hydrolase (beta-lactamase superfamily II)